MTATERRTAAIESARRTISLGRVFVSPYTEAAYDDAAERFMAALEGAYDLLDVAKPQTMQTGTAP